MREKHIPPKVCITCHAKKLGIPVTASDCLGFIECETCTKLNETTNQEGELKMNINQFNSGGSSHPPMDAGTYFGVCVGVVDIGTHTETWEGKDIVRNQLILLFDFPTETIEINGEQKPRCQSLKLTKSTHEQAKLRKHLIAWRGRDFTDDELKDFSLRKLLGIPASIGVIQDTYNGKTYAKILTLGKLPKGVELPKADRKIYFDMLDADTYDAIEELPDWIIKEINQSAEAIAHNKVFMKESKKAEIAQMGSSSVTNNDDETPF